MDCNILKNQKKHVLLIGNTQVGKSSFLKMFYSNNDEVKIGNGNDSCTIEVKPYLCKLQTLFGEEEFVLIDSQGFNDSTNTSFDNNEDEGSDFSIASKLLYCLLKSVASNEMRLDKIIFFQAHQQSNSIPRIFKLISSIIGIDIGEISVIAHTKTNTAITSKVLERETERFKQLAEKLKILGGVVRFETDWYSEEDNEYLYQVSDEKKKQQHKVFQNLIMQSNSSIDLTKEWKNIQKYAKILEKEKFMEECTETVEKYERHWYTLWIAVKHSSVKLKEFIETPQKRLEKAIEIAMKERISAVVNKVYGKEAPKQQQEKYYGFQKEMLYNNNINQHKY